MGAQRSNEEDLDELDIVVDISRDRRVRGPKVAAAMEETDSEESSEGRGKDMEEESDHAPKVKVAMSAAVKLKPHQVEAVVDDEAMDEAHPLASKNGSVMIVREGNNSEGPQESDSPVKSQKSRKRKKTIHFRNSRVPHAIPTLESDSEEEESGSHEEEAEELRVRHAPGPRSAASKV